MSIDNIKYVPEILDAKVRLCSVLHADDVVFLEK